MTVMTVTGIVIVGIIVVFVVVIMLYHACRCSRHHGQRSHQLNHNHYRLAVWQCDRCLILPFSSVLVTCFQMFSELRPLLVVPVPSLAEISSLSCSALCHFFPGFQRHGAQPMRLPGSGCGSPSAATSLRLPPRWQPYGHCISVLFALEKSWK